MSRPGLLNEQQMKELVRADKLQGGAVSTLHADFPNNRPLTFRSEFKIYNHRVFPQLRTWRPCVSKGRTKLTDSKTLDT